MNVRRATPRDVPRLVPLFLAYHNFYGLAPRPRVAARFLASRVRSGEAVVFLAVDRSRRATAGPTARSRAHDVAEQVLGFTLLYPTWSSLRMQRAWVLNDLYVVPDARRRGVARALLERAQRWGERTKAAYLMLETGISNRKAQRLYESLGWKRIRDFYVYELEMGAHVADG